MRVTFIVLVYFFYGLAFLSMGLLVTRHRENIMHNLNLHLRAELVRYAIRKGSIKA